MKNTSIEWCDHTWNPWRGCTRVEKALDCRNCYAATLGHRFGIEWGPEGIRVESSERTWREPFRWAKLPWICDRCGKATDDPEHGHHWTPVPGGLSVMCHSTSFHRARVFALSMGDWLEDEPVRWQMETGCEQSFPVGGIPTGWLARMLDTIRQTPELNWILLTKRPQNWESRMLSVRHFAESSANFELLSWVSRWTHGTPPENVCVMTSVGYQEAAPRISELLRIPARWHGLSLEPLLGPVDLHLNRTDIVVHQLKSCDYAPGYEHVGKKCKLDWLVIGGESGPKARPCGVEWIRDLVGQGRRAGCAVFVKQFGSNSYVPAPYGPITGKGGDPSKWPEDLRVRQFPEGL